MNKESPSFLASAKIAPTKTPESRNPRTGYVSGHWTSGMVARVTRLLQEVLYGLRIGTTVEEGL
ncbi:hypothetical protein BDZ91DRAFT_712850 [Kalaharituber pfeilii]|nr:hypothetical protein BDZ91DRAFT_712850 [Kalaharituber pfeilii]